MGDFLAECLSGFCGVCCVALSSTVTQWSTINRAGADGCCCGGRHIGCCGCCCDKRFNEDTFEDQVRRDMAKTRDPNVPVADQPKATPELTLLASSDESPVQVQSLNKGEDVAEAKAASAVTQTKDGEVKPPIAE